MRIATEAADAVAAYAVGSWSLIMASDTTDQITPGRAAMKIA
jgi:hypothetical protein